MRTYSLPVPTALAALVAAGPAFAQAVKAPAVDPKAVDAAVEKGAAFLRGVLKAGPPTFDPKPAIPHYTRHRWDELILYALHVAGIPKTDPDFAKALEAVVARPPEYTYNAAMRSVLLEAVDRIAYQSAIADCAQFLVDGQCENGQWHYTGRSKTIPGAKPDADSREAATPVYSDAKVKQPPIRIRRAGLGPASGCNSNTQFALLGLLAAQRANVRPPLDTFARAKAWLEKNQNRDGGWCYGGKGGGSYQSMTVGAIGSLAICDTAMRGDPRKNPAILKAVNPWLAKRFAVDRNEGNGQPGDWLYYQLYALERSGQLLEADRLGAIDWYPVGANWILAQQAPDGSWTGPQKQTFEDTPFAILFLRRATRSLVMVETKAGEASR